MVNAVFLSFLSAGMLVLAFPKTDIWSLAWIGLIPLMFALDGRKPLAAFRIAYLCGFAFFASIFTWLFYLSTWFSWIAIFGVILLFLYLALYFGVFGAAYSYFSSRKPIIKLFLLPSAWVCLEYVRAHLFTGFGWGSLGQSQYKNLMIIQIADVTGMFGVSFVVVMINVVLKEFLTVFCCSFRGGNLRSKVDPCLLRDDIVAQKQLSRVLLVAAVVIVCVLGYGQHRMSSIKNEILKDEVSVAVIQGNIKQEMKWDRRFWDDIMQSYVDLTRQAATHKPDLIVWPETAFPGYLWEDQEFLKELQALARQIKIPVLFGSIVKEERNYFNVALLLSQEGDVVGQYKKIHLVPFGEYVPLRSVFPVLSEIVPVADFMKGEEYTMFPLKEKFFSVLICFEDTVARLSGRFINRGAGVLINITNDAWFNDSRAPFMHVQSAVFRTIEQRRDMVRAANTGVSCFINRLGEITKSVERQDKKTYVRGYAIEKVNFNERISFYTKFGDIFTLLCFGCILVSFLKK